MTEFEYKTIVIDSKEAEHSPKVLSDKMNHYGKDGWELVTCFAYQFPLRQFPLAS